MKKPVYALLFVIVVIAAVLAGMMARGAFSFGQFDHSGPVLYWVNASPVIGGLYAGAADGSAPAKKILFNPFSPDAVAIDKENKRIYFTNMRLMDDDNGNLMSADIEKGELTNLTYVVPDGLGIRTPKQLALDKVNQQVYFADREGRRIYRVPMAGIKKASELEVLVDFTSLPENQHQFVGVAVDESHEQFYWTDRFTNTIWRASVNAEHIITPANLAEQASRILTYQQGMLLEIDIDHINRHLYFTDRGEGNEFIGETLPAGFIGRVDLNNLEAGYEVIVPGLLKDPVGLSVSPETGFLYYSTSEDCRIFRRSMRDGQITQIHQGRPFCEGMKFVNW